METAEKLMRLPVDLSVAEAEILLATRLFETEQLSLGQAAELSGLSYREFLEELGRHKIPVLNYDPVDLARELSE